jgi:penicillin amidase
MDDPLDGLREVARSALPPGEGERSLAGLQRDVEVLRDEWGVAYISAASLDDLWFAQGWVTASERCFQLELALRAATGRLSELFADATLPMDRFTRTIGLHRAGAVIAAGYDDASRSMMASFRAGVRSWLDGMPAPPPEYVLLGSMPELPDDEVSWAAATAYLAWGLSGNWEAELLRAMIAERIGREAADALLPRAGTDGVGPSAAGIGEALLDEAPRRSPGTGSNNWVVSGERSSSGKPLLANDPHLLAQQPGAWLEMHLRAPGYEARGVTVPFLPGVLIGTTAHHAWGTTNVTGDTQDLYLERLSDDGTAALFDNAWHPLTLHREAIGVRGRTTPEVLEVRETRHGPILDAYLVGVLDPDVVEHGLAETYALRWAGAERSLAPSSAVAVARASSFEEFREAVRAVECPGQNFVYADVDGTIGYQCTGAYPRRRAGDGTAPVPGWTSEYEWDGFIDFEELPWSKDPERGYLATANQRIHDDAYPHLIGHDFHTPYRARRIVELLEGEHLHSVATFAAMQRDTVSIPARELLPNLLRLTPVTTVTRAALELLEAWDADLRAESAAAAVFEVWTSRIARRVVEPRLGARLFGHYYAWREAFNCRVLPAILSEPESGWWGDHGPAETLGASLDDALRELEDRLGPEPAPWRWGALHQVRFASPLARVPAVAELFTAAVFELGGDEQTVAQSGCDARDGYPAAVVQSWKQVIDLADPDRSLGVLPTGQSGNPASPHWNDQAPLWATGEYHDLPISRRAVEAEAVTALRLTPG